MMNVRREFFIIPVLVASLIGSLSCKNKDAASDSAAGSWQREVETRRAQIEKVKAENNAGFEAMDSGSLGSATLEMIPFVVFRVLQDLEPAAFSDASLSASGFPPRQDMPSGHNGIIWTDPTQAGAFKLRYLTRTCSSCHTARVRLADGTMRLMFGGSNTEIGLHGFIGRLTSTLKADLDASATEPAYQAFRKRILEGLAGHEEGWLLLFRKRRNRSFRPDQRKQTSRQSGRSIPPDTRTGTGRSGASPGRSPRRWRWSAIQPRLTWP